LSKQFHALLMQTARRPLCGHAIPVEKEVMPLPMKLLFPACPVR
jgi:hypothetical protein